jgi:hypothetical protein
MQIEILAKIIGDLPVADSTLRTILQAWFEPDFPSQDETIYADEAAEEVLDNIAKTVAAYGQEGAGE